MTPTPDPPNPPKPTAPRHALVFGSLLSLLAAAAAPSVVEIRREPREAALERVHGALSLALGSVHGRWLVEGGVATELSVRGSLVRLSPNGWPVLDAQYPHQDSTRELLDLLLPNAEALVGADLQKDWTISQQPAHEAGIATFELAGPGGGSFFYDATTGQVSEPQRRGTQAQPALGSILHSPASASPSPAQGAEVTSDAPAEAPTP